MVVMSYMFWLSFALNPCFLNLFKILTYFQDENGDGLTDVESILRKGEEAFKVEDFQSAFNIYTYGLENVR
jgi:hypothetical protein